MEKELELFIDFLDRSDKECCDLEFLASPAEWLYPLLGKKANDFFRIYFRNKAGDLAGEWDLYGNADNRKSLPFVWLSSEGSPRTVIARNTTEFLSLLPYGENIFTGIPELIKAYKRRPGKVISPEEKFSQAAIKESYAYQASQFEGHESMVFFITRTLGIELSETPIATIRNAMDSFPNLDEWIEKNLDGNG